MLSVATGDGRMSDMRGHVPAGSPSKAVKIVEPQVPASAKPSDATNAPGRGRQIKTSKEPANGSTTSNNSNNTKTAKRSKPRTMDELDRRVENDALDLLNMKKEIATQQKLEVKRAMQRLLGVKKEYDVIRAENNVKNSQVKKVKDETLSLRGIDAAVHQSSNKTAQTCKNLTRQLALVEEGAAAEQRTLDMQKMMRARTSADTHSVKIEVVDIETRAEKLRHDVASVEATLQLSRKELLERELKLEKMREQGRGRRKDRASKMSMLHSIVADGQQSVSLVRSSFFTQGGSPHSGTGSPSTLGGNALSPDRGDFNYNLGQGPTIADSAYGHGHSTNTATHSSSGAIRSKPSSAARSSAGFGSGENADPEIDDFVTPADVPRKKAQRMTLAEIEEMVDRYSSRDSRLEKLNQLEVDLKETVAGQKTKKLQLTEEIVQAQQKVAQLASQRQVYHDVENQTRSLHAVKKEYDDCKEKDYRLKVNLISLKRSIPRLLSKLTKVEHPVPTDMQLHDAVNRLMAEISKYFKEISQELAKDATAEDIANGTATDDEKQSEIDKLHNMPGFSKLQKELYFNMMGARPDNSVGNIRVSTDKVGGGAGVGASSGGSINHHQSGSGNDENDANGNLSVGNKHENKRRKEDVYGGPDAESPVIDRAMVKKISALVFERDGKGQIPQALIKAEKGPEPKKKAYVFRD